MPHIPLPTGIAAVLKSQHLHGLELKERDRWGRSGKSRILVALPQFQTSSVLHRFELASLDNPSWGLLHPTLFTRGRRGFYLKLWISKEVDFHTHTPSPSYELSHCFPLLWSSALGRESVPFFSISAKEGKTSLNSRCVCVCMCVKIHVPQCWTNECICVPVGNIDLQTFSWQGFCAF